MLPCVAFPSPSPESSKKSPSRIESLSSPGASPYPWTSRISPCAEDEGLLDLEPVHRYSFRVARSPGSCTPTRRHQSASHGKRHSHDDLHDEGHPSPPLHGSEHQ